MGRPLRHVLNLSLPLSAVSCQLLPLTGAATRATRCLVDRVLPRTLEHPLPAGMRDLLPEEAAARRALSRTVLDRFALFGYRLVTPPEFELAHVVERGLELCPPQQ